MNPIQSKVIEYPAIQGLLILHPVGGYWITIQSEVIESLPVKGYWVLPGWGLLNPTPNQGLLNPTRQGLLNALSVKDYLIPTQSDVIESQPSQGLFDLHSLSVKGIWIPILGRVMNPV